MRKFLLAACLLPFLVFGVNAQPQNCAPRQIVENHLSSNFFETRQGVGLARDGIVEIWADTRDDGDGSWSVTITAPNGMTCLLIAGTDFSELDEILLLDDPT